MVEIALPDLKSGDQCPKCTDGKVYDTPPKVVVKVVGSPPLTATVFKLKQLRCRLCDATFSAVLPEGASAPKYDHSCASMLALLRYGSGMPFYRLEGLQASLNVPLPDATQWEIVSKAVPGPKAVFNELVCQAAQAPLLHNDDTPAKILSLMAERTKIEAAGQVPKNRAINTSGIVAVLTSKQLPLLQDHQRGRGGRHLHEPHPYLCALPYQPLRVSAGAADPRPKGQGHPGAVAALELHRAVGRNRVSGSHLTPPGSGDATPARHQRVSGCPP